MPETACRNRPTVTNGSSALSEAMDSAIGGARERVGETTDTAGSWLDAAEALGEQKAESMFSGDTRVGRAAQSGTVISVVVIGVVALVGILIMAQVEQALPELTDSPLASSRDEVVGGFGDAMGFVPIILIVLLASIVIAVVQRMR